MTNYTKTMMESLAEVRGLQEDNMDLMRKAAKGAMQTIKFKDGKLKMDSFTASGIIGVYDKVNTKNKKAIENIINSGTKAQIMKLQDLAMKASGGAKAGWKLPTKEETELDEGKEKDARQLVNPNKEVMVVKKSKVIVIDKKDQDKYLKQGWSLAEEVDLDEANFEIKNGKIHISKADYAKKSKDYKGKRGGKPTLTALDPKTGATTNFEVVFEEAELDEAEIAFKTKAKDGGHFVVLDRDTSGMRGKQDKFLMRHLKGGKVKELGSHVSVDGAKKFAKNKGIIEEVELDEAKYEIYHKDFSTAMQHAYKMAKKMYGITIDDKEIDDKVATGPKKPSEGKTNKYRLKGDKGGVQIQVYNKGGSKPFELNMYKEEVELEEKWRVTNKDLGVWTGEAKSEKDAKEKAMRKWGVRKSQASSPMFMKNTEVVKEGDELDFVHQTYLHLFDEGTKNDLIVMSKGSKGREVEKSVLPDAKRIKELEREGWKIQGVIEKGSKLIHKEPKRIMKAIKGGDKLKIGEEELDEGKMSELHKHIEDGKSAEEIAKIMKVDEKTIQKLMAGYGEAWEMGTDEYREYLEKLTPGEKVDEGKVSDKLIAMGDDFAKLIKKGGIDKRTYISAQDYIEEGEFKSLAQFAMKQDTEPRDVIIGVVAKHMGRKFAEKTFKVDIQRGEYPEEVEIDEASARADAMRHMRGGGGVDPADVDTSASDDDIKAASKHIIMQLRKVISLKGNFKVEFGDKKKVKIPVQVAQAVIQKYNSIKKPNDKEKFQTKVAKSHRDMLTALKEQLAEAKFVKPRTTPPRLPAMTTAKLAAKKGYKQPGVGETLITGFMKPYLANAMSGKASKGQKLGSDPKAAPTPPVKNVKQLAQVSSKDVERHSKPENLPTVSSIPASGFGPGVKADQPSKKGVSGIPGVAGMAAAKNSMSEETSANYYDQRETILERIDIKLKERKNG